MRLYSTSLFFLFHWILITKIQLPKKTDFRFLRIVKERLLLFNIYDTSHSTGLIIAIPGEFGGAKRDRTADLLRAKQALSQLSYSPWVQIK